MTEEVDIRHLMELLLSQMRKLKVHKVKQTVELYTVWLGGISSRKQLMSNKTEARFCV